MTYRDKDSGVQADFVPEGAEADVVEGGPQRDPDSGVTMDFIPNEDESVEDNSAFHDDAPAGQRTALEKAVAEDAAAQSRPDAPKKFQGPDQDQLGVRKEVEQEPEGKTAVEREREDESAPEEDFPFQDGESREPTERPERVGDGSAEQADSAVTGDEPGSQDELDGPIEDPS